MRQQRVVITGMGAVSPYGEGLTVMLEGLHKNSHALSPLPAYDLDGLSCRVGGIVPPLNAKRIPRELRRCMSSMSILILP